MRGRTALALLLVCLVANVGTSRAADDHSLPAVPAGPVRGGRAVAPSAASWTNRSTWSGRPSPLQLAPEATAGRDAFVRLLEHDAPLIDEGLRLMEDWMRDPVAHKSALLQAFGDFLTLQAGWEHSLSAELGYIEREHNPDARQRMIQAVSGKIRRSLLWAFHSRVLKAKAAGADPGDRAQAGFSGLTRELAHEAGEMAEAQWRKDVLDEMDQSYAIGHAGGLSPAQKEKIRGLSHADLAQLNDLFATWKSQTDPTTVAEELLADPAHLTPEKIHEAHSRYYHPSTGAPEVIPPFHPGIEIFQRTVNLRSAISSFEHAYDWLNKSHETREDLAQRYDTYMKQTTGKSLTEIFRERHLDLDVLASMDDRWLVLAAMRDELIRNLKADRGPEPADGAGKLEFRDFKKAADAALPHLENDFPQWGVTASYHGRTSPFRGPTGVPTETEEQNRARAEAAVQAEYRRYGWISDQTAGQIRRRIWNEFDHAKDAAIAFDEAAFRANHGILDWGSAYILQPGIKRRDLTRVFDGFYADHFHNPHSTLSAEWDGKDLDAPPTDQERTMLHEVLLQHFSQVSSQILANQSAWWGLPAH